MNFQMFSIDNFFLESASGSTTFSTPTTTIERNASLDLDAAEKEKEKVNV